MATKYRFSVEEFERYFSGVNRVELLEGEVYKLGLVTPRHTYCVTGLVHPLIHLFYPNCMVLVRGALELSSVSMPEPDIVLLRPFDEIRYPRSSDVALVIEVSDSTLAYDREQKLPVYAEAGIPEYWIMNLVENVLEVYREPIGRQYRSHTLYQPGEAVEFMGERLEWW